MWLYVLASDRPVLSGRLHYLSGAQFPPGQKRLSIMQLALNYLEAEK